MKTKISPYSIIIIIAVLVLVVLAVVSAIAPKTGREPVRTLDETTTNYTPRSHNDDYWEGWERGLDLGYDDGLMDGYSEAYDEAFYAGMIEGYSYGYDDGAAGRDYDEDAVDQHYTMPYYTGP